MTKKGNPKIFYTTCGILAGIPILIVAILALYVLFIQLPEPSPTTEDLLATVQLGISVKELPQSVSNFKIRSGAVQTPNPDYVPPDEEPDSSNGIYISPPNNESTKMVYYETYGQVKWFIMEEAPDDFTGNITFFRDVRFNSYSMEFVFVDGKLVEKGWGILPG